MMFNATTIILFYNFSQIVEKCIDISSHESSDLKIITRKIITFNNMVHYIGEFWFGVVTFSVITISLDNI